ncbi:putative ABC transporter permease [Dorea acetigenes]|uniref:ABC transporter permease n=1 Tax=Dorea acetigenes TaxID=2981787 RepID=A0ABT2RLW8_9FIRM|nr:putative ABC transporter permease [Dorea acetigenes]MCU6686408.1 putative ABC transporter permease [Dorea acetigenes]SCI93649.1 Predicted membrane protein [uncultured Clostridium sp.]
MRAATAKLENFVLSVSPIAEIGYQRTYSASSLILLFFIFSGMGWIWEVILHIIEDGMIINRGVLAGPWLPIYGAGGILILLLLKKWRRQPFHLFGMIMLLCGTIEYFTSVMLEMLFGVRWWDYSDMLFQLRGRVCLEGLTIFGFGGLFIVYAAAPFLDNRIQKLSTQKRRILCMLLLLLFTGDLLYSFLNPNMGFGITT